MFRAICEVLLEVVNGMSNNAASYDTYETTDIYNSVYNYIRYESYDNIEYLLDNHRTLSMYKDMLYSSNKETMAKDIASFCESRNTMITSYRDR
jgi:hypothetical protein